MRKILATLIYLYLIGGISMADNLFTLESKELKHNEQLPYAQLYNGYGCKGGNISPELSWINAPKNTKSFAIICHDPDAPRPNGWYHWLVVNIPSNVTSIKQGGHIEGALETVTDFDTAGYGGACPPVGHGIHRYNFTIYALDTDKIDTQKSEKPTTVESKILKHTIAKSTITGLYERK